MRATRLIRENVTLRDGRVVTLRPIDRDDAPALMALHDRLSPESQYFRFFGPKPKLTAPEAAYLANVDFDRRFAIVADAPDGDGIVAVGRFDVNEPGLAETAIVVRDDYQRVGLGTAILDRLREIARGRGLDAFMAEILAENKGMLDLLAQNGIEVSTVESGVVRVTSPISRPVLLKGLQIVARTAETLLERRAAPKAD
ncbi:MAG: GNAT family N-acetyltransferase [Candidatus Binatia bacterium]